MALTRPVPARDTQVTLTWTEISQDGRSIRSALTREDDGRYRIAVPFAAVSDGVLRLEYGYDDHIKALGARHATRFGDETEWLPGASPTVTITRQQDWGSLDVAIAMLDAAGRVISRPLAITVDVSPPPWVLGFVDLRYALPAALLMCLLLYAVQQRARRRAQVVLAAAERRRELVEAEMRGRLSEKEILLREIHHRVGNILSNFAASVRQMQRTANTAETREALEQLNARIAVQSAVHMLLQRSDSTDINVANMLRQVCAGARDLLGARAAQPIALALDDIYMTYSKAQYLGLIVNELLTNTYEHGVGTTAQEVASVSLRWRDDGAAQFEYRDYGPGLSPGAISEALADTREANGGLRQVVALVRELRAEPSLESVSDAAGTGMRLRFRLPPRLLRARPAMPAPRDAVPGSGESEPSRARDD